MSLFVHAIPPTTPKTKNVTQISLLLAGILALFALTQLLTLSAFTRLVESFWLPGGVRLAHFLTASIIITEVLALPFLLRIRLSPAMRQLSMVCGWVVALTWLVVSLWLMLTVNAIHNIGFIGVAVDLQPGWWAVLFSISIAILSAWASWGMWPMRMKK